MLDYIISIAITCYRSALMAMKLANPCLYIYSLLNLMTEEIKVGHATFLLWPAQLIVVDICLNCVSNNQNKAGSTLTGKNMIPLIPLRHKVLDPSGSNYLVVKRMLHYIQGQSPSKGIREYFYYIDHQGMVRLRYFSMHLYLHTLDFL